MVNKVPRYSLSAKRLPFGELADGTHVEAVELRNQHGMQARIVALGACLQTLEVPDAQGVLADVVLGYARAQTYLDHPQCLGVSVGRYANRIARARFSLDGSVYHLTANHGAHHLHGGEAGFDRQLWRIESVTTTPVPAVTLSYASADGESGYPGNVLVQVTYTLNNANELSVRYQATTDKPTLVNLTNHSYFNLAGEPAGADVLDHVLTLHASAFTPVDGELIPTGERRLVAGSSFDFRGGRRLGDCLSDVTDPQLLIGRGLDHNFIIDGDSGHLRPAAQLYDPGSGRTMTISTTAPGLQIYSGNGLDGSTHGKSGRAYEPRTGVCLEPQTFPNSPNQADFPSARLNPGEFYLSETAYSFSALRR